MCPFDVVVRIGFVVWGCSSGVGSRRAVGCCVVEQIVMWVSVGAGLWAVGGRVCCFVCEWGVALGWRGDGCVVVGVLGLVLMRGERCYLMYDLGVGYAGGIWLWVWVIWRWGG